MCYRILHFVLVVLVCILVFTPEGMAARSTSGDEFWSSDFFPMGVGGRLECAISWNGYVFVGGYFSSITDVPTDHVAQFQLSNGVPRFVTNVTALGDGLDDSVKEFCIHDGELVAAGYFDRSGERILNRVARWDGAQWQPFGDGLPGTWPRTAASYQGQLFVGGQRWNGSDWEEVFPANGLITKLVVQDGLLFVGGEFTEVDGMPRNYVFAWDGTQILDLDGGFPWPIHTGVSTDDGVVFAGQGDFALGGVQLWDGASWIVEASDMRARELAWSGGELYAAASVDLGGGMFETGLLVKRQGAWETVSNFSASLLVDHEGILLAGANPGDISGCFSPGLVQYDGAMRDVFPNNGGFANGFTALAPRGTGVLAVGDFKIAQGQPYDGSALVVGSNWSPWGGAADLGTPYPGHFTDVAVIGTSVFGVYRWMDYDVEISQLVQSVTTTFPWEWEFVDTDTWYTGLLQNVDDTLYSITREAVKWVNPTDGSLFSVAEFDLTGGIYGQCEYNGGFVISGAFSTLDEIPVGDVLHWAAGTWADLGEPMPNLRVTAVAPMDGSQLAAASWVASESNFVSLYDGDTWTQLPGEFSDMISNLIFHRGRLFAAGKFDRIGSTWAPGIAVWTGQGWVPVGSGLRGSSGYWRVKDLASVNGVLYVAGDFELAGPHPSTGFAAWSGDPALLTGITSQVSENPQLPGRLLDPVTPNPFNPRTKLSFTTSETEHVLVEIFDVRGKRVRELVNEVISAGTHSRQWDGMDDGGRALSSGVYLARIFAGERTDAVKMTLVR
jgi:FlgD Ig-like domain